LSGDQVVWSSPPCYSAIQCPLHTGVLPAHLGRPCLQAPVILACGRRPALGYAALPRLLTITLDYNADEIIHNHYTKPLYYYVINGRANRYLRWLPLSLIRVVFRTLPPAPIEAAAFRCTVDRPPRPGKRYFFLPTAAPWYQRTFRDDCERGSNDKKNERNYPFCLGYRRGVAPLVGFRQIRAVVSLQFPKRRVSSKGSRRRRSI